MSLEQLRALLARLQATRRQIERGGVTEAERRRFDRIQAQIDETMQALSREGEEVVVANQGGLSQSQRLEERAGDVNEGIRQIVSADIAPIVSGMDRAAGQFESWYQRSHSAGGGVGLAVGSITCVAGIVLALFPPGEIALLVAEVAMAALSEAAARADDSTGAEAQDGVEAARRLAADMRAAANRLENAFGDSFAERLRRDRSDVWSMVGLMILDGNTGTARSTLHADAGVPRPRGNPGRAILQQMIAEQLRWDRRYRAEHGSIEAQLTQGVPAVEAETDQNAARQAEELMPD